MPNAAPRICSRCNHTEPCPQHGREVRRKEYDKNRSPAHERGYDRNWRKVRKRYLSRHPLCEDCQERGEIKPAEEVHHLTPIRESPVVRLDASNLRALCRACHRRRHCEAS